MGKSGKEKGPRAEGTTHTPYRWPFRSSFSPSGIGNRTALLLPPPTMDNPRSDRHPALLSPPTLGNPRTDSHPNRQLDDIYATLNDLVSQLKSSTKRMLCEYRMPLDDRPELSDGPCFNEPCSLTYMQPMPPIDYSRTCIAQYDSQLT